MNACLDTPVLIRLGDIYISTESFVNLWTPSKPRTCESVVFFSLLLFILPFCFLLKVLNLEKGETPENECQSNKNYITLC